MSLVLIDLDDFKSINDTKGHAYGDEALTHFGAIVKRGLRRVDRPLRVGGDEFAILLPQTDAEAANIVIRRLLASALQPALRSHVDPGSLSPQPASRRCPSQPPGAPSSTAGRCGAVRRQARRAHRGHGLRPRGDSDRRSTGWGSGGRGRGPSGCGRSQPIMEAKSGRCWASGLIRPISPAPFADPASLFKPPRAAGTCCRWAGLRGDRGQGRRAAREPVPVHQPVAGDHGGAVQHCRAAEHPGPPRAPRSGW